MSPRRKEIAMSEMGLFEGIRTLRAIREFTDEPVSDAEIATMLELAVCAPSGGNRQPWHFVVIRDPSTRRTIRDYYVDVFRRYREGVVRQAAEGHAAAKAQVARWERSGSPDAFAESLDRVPVLILVCLDRQRLGFSSADPAEPLPPTAWASIYPAVQNLLLAAHGLGLGAVLTTLHMPHEAEIKTLLSIPAHVHTAALVPVGHPRRKHGPPRRIPASERTHRERWNGR
jgi:nitroreductase